MSGLPTILLYASISEQVFTEAPFAFYVRDVPVSPNRKTATTQRVSARCSKTAKADKDVKEILNGETTRVAGEVGSSQSGTDRHSRASTHLTVTALVEVNSGGKC